MTLYDPEGVEQCLQAGLNATLSLEGQGQDPTTNTGRLYR